MKITRSLKAMALSAVLMAAAGAQTPQSAGTVRFMTLDPGHFHAGLVHKEMYPQVHPQVHIYAPLGNDLIEHLKRIVNFNTRADNPTKWLVEIHASPDFYERMIADKPGNVVVLSGRNSKKIDYLQGSAGAGLNILADKPWIIDAADLPRLEATLKTAAGKNLVAYDIMTERHEITSILQRMMINTPAVYGEQVKGTAEEPGVYMESIHHIMKTVAGQPLRRPAWFFDIREQGEALSDVGTHLVDLSLWTLFPNQAVTRDDVTMGAAKRWPTTLTREQFETVTGEKTFPAFLSEWVKDDKLDYICNTQVGYALRGVHVKLDVLWNLSAPHGDTHVAIYRGTKSRVEVRQGEAEKFRPETYVIPNNPADKGEILAAIRQHLTALDVLSKKAGDPIGIEEAGEGFRFTIPDSYRVGHEFHFAEVTAEFLNYLKDPTSMPEWETTNMLTKYYITTKGVEISRQ